MISKVVLIVLSIFVLGTTAKPSDRNFGQYNDEQYNYGSSGYGQNEYEQNGYKQQPYKQNSYENNGYNKAEKTQGGYVFPPPTSLVDPQYYMSILTDFETCLSQKCQTFSKQGYGKSVTDSLQVVGKYTSCVTECSAYQIVRAARDFKNLVALMFDVSSNKLTQVRKYISDSEYYDVLGNRSRIDESCCLPKDRFVPWDRIFMPVNISFVAQGNKELPRMMSVADYLHVCTTSTQLTEGWLKNVKVQCDSRWVIYLEALQANVGHLVLSPSCLRDFRDGNCAKNAARNPRADTFTNDVCVAYECLNDGASSPVNIPLIRELNGSICNDDVIRNDQRKRTIIKYRRIPYDTLKYYTVTTGLPSLFDEGDIQAAMHDLDKSKLASCNYTSGLATRTSGFFHHPTPPTSEVITATNKCPRHGRFEYCNVQQFAGHLEKQLFDVSRCNINDFANSGYDEATGFHFTLACQYRVLSLKCDCMEAVMNCYNSEYEFTSSIGKVLGKAASIMCGLILCQRPKVFSLFGETSAVNRAHLMKQVLLQAGAMVPDNSSVPPATVAFLTFGMGMVAFVVVKVALKNIRRSTVNTEDGYRNLI